MTPEIKISIIIAMVGVICLLVMRYARDNVHLKFKEPFRIPE
jgi:hypothetical protein